MTGRENWRRRRPCPTISRPSSPSHSPFFIQTPRMKELPKIFALQTLTPAPQDFVIHIVEMTQITRKMCLILNLVSVFCFAASICYIKFGPKCQLNFHFPLSFLFLPRLDQPGFQFCYYRHPGTLSYKSLTGGVLCPSHQFLQLHSAVSAPPALIHNCSIPGT